jgi:hypothetical protein
MCYYTLIASTERVYTHFCLAGIIIGLHQPLDSVGILKDFTIHHFSGGMSRMSLAAPPKKVWLRSENYCVHAQYDVRMLSVE